MFILLLFDFLWWDRVSIGELLSLPSRWDSSPRYTYQPANIPIYFHFSASLTWKPFFLLFFVVFCCGLAIAVLFFPTSCEVCLWGFPFFGGVDAFLVAPFFFSVELLFLKPCLTLSEMSDLSFKMSDLSPKMSEIFSEMSDFFSEMSDFFSEMSDFFSEMSDFFLNHSIFRAVSVCLPWSRGVVCFFAVTIGAWLSFFCLLRSVKWFSILPLARTRARIRTGVLCFLLSHLSQS